MLNHPTIQQAQYIKTHSPASIPASCYAATNILTSKETPLQQSHVAWSCNTKQTYHKTVKQVKIRRYKYHIIYITANVTECIASTKIHIKRTPSKKDRWNIPVVSTVCDNCNCLRCWDCFFIIIYELLELFGWLHRYTIHLLLLTHSIEVKRKWSR